MKTLINSMHALWLWVMDPLDEDTEERVGA